MGYGNTQEPPSKKRREAGVRPIHRFGQLVDEGELAKLKSERSKNNLAPLKRTTGPNVEGPLRFASPVEPADVASGNFTLPGGCDQYITPDCIRGTNISLE